MKRRNPEGRPLRDDVPEPPAFIFVVAARLLSAPTLRAPRILPCAGSALAADATGTPAAATGTGAASPISIATGGTSPRIRAFHSDIVLPASNH